jgi:hypothetical protein
MMLLLCLPVILVGAGCMTSCHTHPEFAARRAELKSVAVLPCRYRELMVRVMGIENQTSTDDVQAVDQCLQRQISDELRARGWMVANGRLRQAEPVAETNQDLPGRQEWMHKQLNNAYQYLPPSQQMENWIVHSCPIRPEGPLLAKYESVDALVFTFVTIVRESPEAATVRQTGNAISILAAFFGGRSSGSIQGSPEHKTFYVLLVDGRNGEILWRSSINFESADGDGLAEAAKKVFQTYPHE